jgi:hypothetical protein
MMFFAVAQTLVLPALSSGSGEAAAGAAALAGSAVVATRNAWKARLLRRKVPAIASEAGLMPGGDHLYGPADSQSPVLRRFNDLKDLVATEAA